MVIMEWLAGILTDASVKFTNPGTGKPMLFISTEPIYTKKWTNFGVNKRSPWLEQMNDILIRCLGLGKTVCNDLEVKFWVKELFLEGQ